MSSILALPSGCLYQNSSTIDKGTCDTNACYSDETSSCDGQTQNCCGPTSLSQILVDCDTYSLPIYLVERCGCTLCRQNTLTIYGFAGTREGDPLYYGDIYWNGTRITNTSNDGTFSLTVDTTIARASILFVDSFNKTLMDSTYVFEMPDDNEDSQYIRVILLPKERTVSLNASEDSTLVLNSTEIDIPAGAFYTSDGQLYTASIMLKTQCSFIQTNFKTIMLI